MDKTNEALEALFEIEEFILGLSKKANEFEDKKIHIPNLARIGIISQALQSRAGQAGDVEKDRLIASMAEGKQ